jgi:hypothetical protein
MKKKKQNIPSLEVLYKTEELLDATLKKLKVSYFVILDDSERSYLLKRSLLYKIEQMNKNPKFKLLYKYKENYLWELKD